MYDVVSADRFCLDDGPKYHLLMMHLEHYRRERVRAKYLVDVIVKMTCDIGTSSKYLSHRPNLVIFLEVRCGFS